MKEIYVPYAGQEPASLVINGHELLIVSPDKDELLEHLIAIGGDRIEGIAVEESEEEFFSELSEKIQAGVVLAPDGVGLDELLQSLATELPWLQ